MGEFPNGICGNGHDGWMNGRLVCLFSLFFFVLFHC